MIVAALVVVNAVGEVLAENGEILAGLRGEQGGFIPLLDALRKVMAASLPPASGENTVIGVVATNAKLDKVGATKVAQMAHDGLARTVRPSHTMYDGDTFFALATGTVFADLTLVGAYGAEVVAQAIRNGIRSAATLAGVRSHAD